LVGFVVKEFGEELTTKVAKGTKEEGVGLCLGELCGEGMWRGINHEGRKGHEGRGSRAFASVGLVSFVVKEFGGELTTKVAKGTKEEGVGLCLGGLGELCGEGIWREINHEGHKGHEGRGSRAWCQ
jgi:hypothetical protein